MAAQLGLSTEVPEEAKALETMRAGGAKDSTRLLIDYLDRVQPHLVTYEDKLKPFFKGESPLPRLAEVKAALEQADARQEMLRASLPSETLKHYEAKGRLLEIIERINHVAQLAFDGQADRIGLFNKDILLRAHRRSRKESSDSGEKQPTPKVDEPKPG